MTRRCTNHEVARKIIEQNGTFLADALYKKNEFYFKPKKLLSCQLAIFDFTKFHKIDIGVGGGGDPLYPSFNLPHKVL